MSSRFRVFEAQSANFSASRSDVSSNGTTSGATWQYPDVQTSLDTLQDVVVPNFKERSARGEIIINPFHRYTYRAEVSSGSHGAYNTSGQSYSWSGHMLLRVCENQFGAGDLGAILGVDLGLIPFSDLFDHELRQKKELAVRLEKSRYAFGEDVAEIRKSLAGIQNMITTVANMVARVPALTQRIMKNGFTFQQALAKAWLRIRYELRPMLISLENAIQISEAGLNAAIGLRQRVTEYEKLNKTRYKTHQNGALVDGLWTLHIREEHECRLNTGFIFENWDPIATDLQQLGLGAKDLAPTIWAITRFSFLVDKFVNITNLIRGMQNVLDPDIKILGGWQNWNHSYTKHSWLTYVRSGSGWSSSTNTYDVNVELSDKRRSPTTLDIADVMSIDFEVPTWETFVDLYSIFVSPKLRYTSLRV